MSVPDPPIVTRSRLAANLRTLGLEGGDILMLHASVKSVGWIVGGPEIVLHAILDVLGPEGTLMMYIKCETRPTISTPGQKITAKPTWTSIPPLISIERERIASGAY